MTDEKATVEPLWTGEQIKDFAFVYSAESAVWMLCQMRDQYEAERTQLLAEIAQWKERFQAYLLDDMRMTDELAKRDAHIAHITSDAHIDALIMSIATYTASVPVMPERDVAMAAMRGIVRGWMSEA